MEYDSDLLTLKELCNILSISIATGRNWLKLNKLAPTKTIGNKPYFSASYVRRIKKELSSDTSYALKSRRNKKFISGNGIYKSYISSSANNQSVQTVLDLLSKSQIELTKERIDILIAECALQLLCQRTQPDKAACGQLLGKYLARELNLAPYCPLIDDFIISSQSALKFIRENKLLFDVTYRYEEKEDILGLLYISLKNIGSRKATGSYYTPTETIHQLIDGLDLTQKALTQSTVLDPCCGTGNFLLQLPAVFDFQNIYGNDIDSTSIKITRLNIALKFQIKHIDLLYRNFTISDFLSAKNRKKYDYIIGNPPWGFSFSDTEKKYLCANYQCAKKKSVESYDVFIEQALSQLSPNGTLAFVLPKAILNVKNHTPIREIILKETSITRIDYLGEIFHTVQCPSIILQMVHTEKPLSCIGMTITDQRRSFTIRTERKVTADAFHFLADDTEYRILEKILHLSNQTTLKNQADFALGIVTGNNKKYISHTKTPENELILKGSDISRYQIREPENFITFTPERFQQVAPTEYYRAPEKLFYRFICKQPVFAYDDKQRLSLNSCNIVIPHIEGLDMKYILAIFNSGVVRFLFTRHFDSVKVLRSHLEQIPIPVTASARQKEILQRVDVLLNETDNAAFQAEYEKLDKIIAGLFGLTDEEYEVIHNS